MSDSGYGSGNPTFPQYNDAGDSNSNSSRSDANNAASTPPKAAKKGAKRKGPLDPKSARVEKKSTSEDRLYFKEDYSGRLALPNPQTGMQWVLFTHERTNRREQSGNQSLLGWWRYQQQVGQAGRYVCVCGKTTGRQGDMDRHIIQQHYGLGRAQCQHCRAWFINATYMKKIHKANLCERKQKPHSCGCGKRFADPSAARKCSKKCGGTPHTPTRPARRVPLVFTSPEEVNRDEAYENASFPALEYPRVPHTTLTAQPSGSVAPASQMEANRDEYASSGSPNFCSPPEGLLTPPNVANRFATSYTLDNEDFGMQAVAWHPQAVNSYGTTHTGFSTHQTTMAGLGSQPGLSEMLAPQPGVFADNMMVDNPLDLPSHYYAGDADVDSQGSLPWEPLERLQYEQLNNTPGVFPDTTQGLVGEAQIFHPEPYQLGDAAQLPSNGQLENYGGNTVDPSWPAANNDAAIDPRLRGFMLADEEDEAWLATF